MRKIYILLVLLITTVIGCTTQQKVQPITLNGKVEGIADQKIYLTASNGKVIFAEGEIKNGEFTMQATINNTPAEFTLKLEDTQYWIRDRVIVDQGAVLSVEMRVDSSKIDPSGGYIFPETKKLKIPLPQ